MTSPERRPSPPCALAIAGLDPSGGAGLLADARAMRAFGVHALAVATAFTAQNTLGSRRFEPTSLAMLRAQIEVLLEDTTPRAAKIGMLPSPSHAQVLAELLAGLGTPIIYDTVFAPSSGRSFLGGDEALDALKILGPRCELATPNITEAQALCGFEIRHFEDIARAAKQICERFSVGAVLIKGGHAEALDSSTCSDWLWDGRGLTEFPAPRLDVPEARGTGCLLSSAIAAQRAKGTALEDCIREAKAWLGNQIPRAVAIGSGRRVIVDFDF